MTQNLYARLSRTLVWITAESVDGQELHLTSTDEQTVHANSLQTTTSID